MKKRNITTSIFSLTMFFSLFVFTSSGFAHCEIPCGIYADSMRVVMISEDITTIEKSMNQIIELSKADIIDYNQLVRWINNKEEHANKIQDIATQYFMFQRVKVSDDPVQIEKNMKQLDLLHKLCVYAMKAKQTTDLEQIKKMSETLKAFSELYFDKAHQHH